MSKHAHLGCYAWYIMTCGYRKGPPPQETGFADPGPGRAQEKLEIVEKAVDCLRIITTGNDVNKRALVEIPIALPALVRLLEQPQKVCHRSHLAIVANQ